MTRARTPRLGQHLLTNPRVSARLADAARVTSGTRVLEVGPGKGALTAELLARGARVLAVEKDPAFAAILREQFADALASGALTLIDGDIRDHTPDALMGHAPYVVAANIPYYITGELIRTFLTAAHQPTAIALLVQKEVAERIARSKKESILSLSVKVYGEPRYITTVSRGNFSPPPTVDSAILAITDISRKNFASASEERFFEIVKAGFAQKRKTLAGNLTRALGTSLGVPPNIRAEDVPLATWRMLAERAH